MKKLLLTAVIFAGCLSAGTTAGQEPARPVNESPAAVNSRAPNWQSSYQQETARDYIRRRAQEKTAARQARIEGMKWLGYSPSRPVVSTTPFMSSVPSWVPVYPTAYWSGYWQSRVIYSPGW